MSYYSYGYAPTTAYLAVKKLWDSLLHKQVQQSLFFKDMIGRDDGGEDAANFSNYPIVEKTQLGKDSGDAITMSLVRQLVTSTFYNAGVTGNTQLVDSETAMSFYTTKVYVSHWRDATAILGKQTMQRSPFDLRSQAKGLLANEVAQFLDQGLFFCLYSGYSPNVVREIGTSTLLEKLPLNNIYGKDQTALANLAVTDTVDTELLDIVSTVCVTNNINAVKHEGRGRWGFVIHPFGTKTLRADSLYQDAQIHANKGTGIFSRAIGEWGDLYILEHNGIDYAKNYGSLTVSSDAITIAAASPGTTNTDTRMNLLIGANAVARARALPEYMAARKEDDYGNIVAWASGLIYGDRRADYQIDDGTGSTFKNQSSICVYSYSPTVAGNFTAIWS
jgi:hypothetical protein